MNTNCGIYMIMNLVNGKFYIGSSKQIKRRLYLHKNSLRKNKHHSIYLQRAWNKYGEENFIFEVIKNTSLDDRLIEEQKWLDYHKVYDEDYGYNISSIVDNVFKNTKRSSEFCLKRSIQEKEKWAKMSIEERNNHPINSNVRRGHKLSKEHIAIISKLTPFTINSPESIIKRREGVRRSNAKRFNKPVLQFSKEGKFIQMFPSIKSANILLGRHIYSQGIPRACKGKQEFSGGFKWEFKNKYI